MAEAIIRLIRAFELQTIVTASHAVNEVVEARIRELETAP